MNFKQFQIEAIAAVLIPELNVTLNDEREKFLNGNEFKYHVQKEIQTVEAITEAVNVLPQGVDIDLLLKKGEHATIDIGQYSFGYNEEQDRFELRTWGNKLEDYLIEKVRNEFHVNSLWRKQNHIADLVRAILSTMDSTSYSNAKELVRNQINVKEILFNKNI